MRIPFWIYCTKNACDTFELFAEMNDYLHAAKKNWEAVQTLFSAMKEMQELVAIRVGSNTKVVFTPPALQFLYAVLVLIADGCP